MGILYLPIFLGARICWCHGLWKTIQRSSTSSIAPTSRPFCCRSYVLIFTPLSQSAHLRQTIFAFLSSPSTTLSRIFFSMLWIWLHLLQFCVSNQSLDPEEDASNKPWRPIPSGLISVGSARLLRWMLLPLCLSVSVRLGVYWQGISLVLAFLSHNEFGFHSHLFMRNICNAWGYASFNAGAYAIASGMLCSPTPPAYPTIVLNRPFLCTRRVHDYRAYNSFLRHQCSYNRFNNLRPRFPRRNRGQAHETTDYPDSMARRKSYRHLYNVGCVVHWSGLGL